MIFLFYSIPDLIRDPQKWLWIPAFAGMLTVGTVYADDLPPECRYLPKYEQPDDVAYKPGVDVHGKPVASADLKAAPFELPDIITVPLTVDLVERARDLPGQYEGLEAKGDLGVIEIHKDGLVTWNGQDWSAQFYAICGLKEHGLPEEDAVISAEERKNPPQKSPDPKDNERVIFGNEYRD